MQQLFMATDYTVRVSATTSDGSTFVTSRQINAG